LKRICSSTALLGLASLAFARQARGQDDANPDARARELETAVGVAYEAPSSCPDASVFMERLRARTAHVDLAPVAEVAGFAVVVSSTDTSSSARIRISGAGVLPETRTVSGRTCDEVVSAAALITALAIEASSSAPPLRADRAETTPNPPPRDTPPTLSSNEAPRGWLRSWGFGATGGVDSLVPGGGLAWGVFGELAARAPLDLARLTLRGTAGSASAEGRSATFTALMARLTLCPLSLQIVESFFLIPCAGVDVGQLAGEGEPSAQLATPRSAAIFWSSADVMLLARWHLGGVFALEAGGELGFPLVRHTFVFEGPSQLVYEVPAVGAGAHLGLALRFH
jgi:hypothetical protein